MNLYSGSNSIIVLDNTRIHHDKGLIEYLQAFSICIEFFSSYSSDLNSIETAFSVIKNFFKKN